MEECAEPNSTPSPTKEQSKEIQAINRDTVHRICSGQVVLNLATAVKELVENSLDAGATSVEIRLREYGSELIEVIDNGCGVEEVNFRGLTLKHHTSKLREFSDLVDVGTFGFRGEALSSLCALSEMTVTTRHKWSEVGTKLTFDSRGHISSQIPCARQVGTTVQLAKIFSSLPVRQKEFLRNLKREFMKMTQLLYAYCLISTGVKLLCTNQTKKGSRSVVASTQGSTTYKGNISCIFGAKQASTLLDLEHEEPKKEQLEEMGLTVTSNTSAFKLEGCISSCAHGQGRSATDRQFFYINSRPCEPSKVSKVVNEVYHQYNTHQFPFVFINIKTDRSSVDVNVTPDKRQVFLENEKLLLATIKATLLRLYEKIPCSLQFQNVAIASEQLKPECSPTLPILPSSKTLSSASAPASPVQAPLKGLSSLLKSFTHSGGASDKDRPSERSPQQFKRGMKRTLDTSMYDRDGRKQLCLSAFVKSKENQVTQEQTKANDHPTESSVVEDVNSSAETSVEAYKSYICQDTEENPSENQFSSNECDPSKLNAHTEEVEVFDEPNKFTLVTVDNSVSIQKREVSTNDPSFSSQHDEGNCNAVTEVIEITSENPETKEVCPRLILDEPDINVISGRKVVQLNITMDIVRHKCQEKQQRVQSGKTSDDDSRRGSRVRFYSEINPAKNKNAEQELKKEISKDMFSQMKIIGQFNLGFIITQLGPDIFIVDQHATDEKYNFEMLQLHTVIHNQKLVIPQALELTAVNESILIDNIDIFHKNGFEFVINKDAEATKRVCLAAKPTSQNWEFGKDDIDELLFMLQDSPHTMCRPSRVRSMFASRACRKSVMIGTALSKSTMRQLVNHMGEIEQPWNCPHGRPTMRHLINLELVRKMK